MFEPLTDPAFFAQVVVDHDTVVWPNGLDLDPLVLHGDFEPARSERVTRPPLARTDAAGSHQGASDRRTSQCHWRPFRA